MSKPLKIFITYAHKNTEAKDELVTHLAVMKSEGLISIWHDNEITAGDTWCDAIFNNLNDSDILLYLVSAYSLASENCNKELAAALNAEIKVIPVILESCDWLNHKLSDFQALPERGKPISQWEHKGAGWQNVVEGIRKSVTEMSSYTSEDTQRGTLSDRVFQRGNFLVMIGQTEMAIETYSDAIELTPFLPAYYNNRGVAYRETDNLPEALKDYNTAIRLKQDFAEAYNNRGRVYYDIDDSLKALEDYNKAIQLKNDFAEAYNNRGVAYANEEIFDNAIRDFNIAISLNQYYADAYYNRANAHRLNGNFDKALDDFTTLISLGLYLADAYRKRGSVYGIKGNYDKSIDDFTKAIQLKLNDVTIYYDRGNAYLLKGDFDKAIDDYDMLIELDIDDTMSYCHRGFAWLHLKEWDKARSDLTSAKNMGVDIVKAFHNTYRDVYTFERRNDVKVPKDISLMLREYTVNPFTTTQRIVTHNGKTQESAAVLELLEKFRNAGNPLREYLPEPSSRGITTGYNEAFIIHSEKRDALITEHPSSADILKPFLMARDIKRWRVKPTDEWRREKQDKWLIWTHRGIDINAYPAIKKHLEKTREALEKRSGKQEWYELQTVPKGTPTCEQPKCIYPDLASATAFAYDDEGYYVGSPASLLPTSELWILGVLNTRAVTWFYARTAPQIRGQFLKFTSRYVSQIPIPDMEPEQRALIHKIVEYILYLKKQPTTDSKDLAHSRDFVMVGYFGNILNGLIYELYLPDQLHRGDKYFFQPLFDEKLPKLEKIQENGVDAMHTFRDIFERLCDKHHPVARNLFFMSSVKPIRIIEGRT